MRILFFLGLPILCLIFPTIAWANSSWHWVTVSPKQILPIAVIVTLAVETIGLITFGKVRGNLRAFIAVAFANTVSFVTPYLERAVPMFYRGTVPGDWNHAWDKAFNAGPYYMVGIGYFLLTILLELPLIYCFLRKHTESKKQLFIAIIFVNIITTAIVAIMERIFCQGQW